MPFSLYRGLGSLGGDKRVKVPVLRPGAGWSGAGGKKVRKILLPPRRRTKGHEAESHFTECWLCPSFKPSLGYKLRLVWQIWIETSFGGLFASRFIELRSRHWKFHFAILFKIFWGNLLFSIFEFQCSTLKFFDTFQLCFLDFQSLRTDETRTAQFYKQMKVITNRVVQKCVNAKLPASFNDSFEIFIQTKTMNTAGAVVGFFYLPAAWLHCLGNKAN